MELSRKAMSVAPSATLAINARAQELRDEGKDVVNFGVGEPDFDTPAFIREAARKAMDEGKTRYTPVAGTLSLRKAVCEKLKNENHAVYNPNQIVVSGGAKHSLYNAFQVILNPEDEVIIPSPCWVSYPEMVRLAGGKAVLVPCAEEDGFLPRMEAICAAITPKTKAILLCNPCNPTGAVYDRALLQAIADLAVEKDFFIIADEIYEKLVYNGREHISVVSLGEAVREHTILINGASKAFAMTGWRIGYAAAPEAVARCMASIQSQETSSANTIAQYATEAALLGPKEELNEMVEAFAYRCTLLAEGINAINGLSCVRPDGAFYVLMNISKLIGRKHNGTVITGSEAFARELLNTNHVALVPGKAFGTDEHVRISYATDSTTLRKGLLGIASFVATLEE